MASEEPVVKAFNKTLFSLKDSKAPISKQKIVEVTKAGMSALRFYKHVVLSVEKFVQKCGPSFKVSAFYIVDSIVRQGIKQHSNKDVFGPRFAINLTKTLEKGLECSDEDKLKIVRVINLWKTHNVFPPDVIESLLNHCRSIGLEVDIKSVELKVKGDKADLAIYSQDGKKAKKITPKTPPRNEANDPTAAQTSQELTHSDVVPLNGISEKEISSRLQQTFPQWAELIDRNQGAFEKFANLVNEGLKERVDREKANQGANISSILTQDFDYSDEEEEVKQKSEFNIPREKIDNFVNEIFTDANFRANTAGIYTSTLSATKPPQQNQFPDVSNIFTNKPPPVSAHNPWLNQMSNFQAFPNPFAPDQNAIPMPVPSPVKSQQSDTEKVDSSRRSRHERKRDRERSPEGRSSDKKRRHRSRSPSVSEKDKEKERRRLGLPSRPREEHTIIASRTLWFGRLPTNCNEQDIRNSVKESGSDPERINIISSRACAYVTMPNRRSAYKIIDRLHRDIKVSGRSIKLEWATSSGLQKSDKVMEYWDKNRGYLEVPHKKLPKDLNSLLEGNYLDVDTLPSHLKGKYTESGPVANEEPQDIIAIHNIQPPAEIPLPTTAQLPQGLPQFPPGMPTDGATLHGVYNSLGFPGLIQPNLIAAVLAQQQQPPPNFENLFTALQQNPGAGLLPSPVGQPPNIFANLSFDNNADNQVNDQQFQPKFNTPRGNFQPRFRGRGGFAGGENRGNFRPRFGNRGGQNGEFRPRFGNRGDQNGGFRPRFGGRGNFNNANLQPLPAFNNRFGGNIGDVLPMARPPPADLSQQPMDQENNNMDIEENSLSA